MKPNDLKPVFSFEERRPLIDDHIFYVPLRYKAYSSFVLPNLCEHFGNTHPVAVEYCSGNGDWIVERAQQFRDTNWIAVEKRYDRVKKIWSKLKNLQITNLLIVSGEAMTFTYHYLKDNSIEEIYINFPDPWPKKKHTKHRLIKASFLDELLRVMKQDTQITLVTDDFICMSQIMALFNKHPHFSPRFPPPFYAHTLENYGSSWFEKLWREKGKQIHYTQYLKNGTAN